MRLPTASTARSVRGRRLERIRSRWRALDNAPDEPAHVLRNVLIRESRAGSERDSLGGLELDRRRGLAVRAGWERGERPRIEAFLDEVSEPHRPLLLDELVRVEVELRPCTAEQPTVEEYRRRFPEHDALIISVFQTRAGLAAREGTGGASTGSTLAGSLPGAAPKSSLPPELADHPDYEIVRELGRGGMGVVYLAHNRLMGRDEVLKVIGPQIVERPGVLDRFLREIRAVARLRHPNIVSAYSAFRSGESLVFAMEYVEGLDLARMVKAKGPHAGGPRLLLRAPGGPGPAARARAGHGPSRHQAGQPDALAGPGPGGDQGARLRAGQGRARAAGASSARRLAPRLAAGAGLALTATGQMLGTPDFIAPEQIADAQGADIRADIYSLGCTLYYLLSGGPPFPAETLYDVLQAHHSTEARPLDLVRPDVPVELAALVAKMMAKDPDQRFSEPSEVVEVLTPFTRGNTTALQPPGDQPGTHRRGNAPCHPGRPRGTSGPSTRKADASPGAENRQTELEWMKLIRFSDSEIIPPGAITPASEEKPAPALQAVPAAVADPTTPSASPAILRPHAIRPARRWIALAGLVGIAAFLLAVPAIDRMTRPLPGPLRRPSPPDISAPAGAVIPVSTSSGENYGPGYAVGFEDGDTNPGRALLQSDFRPVSSNKDLSYEIFTAYTTSDLYVAFKVIDDHFVADNSDVIQNDHVELFFDVDRMANDFLWSSDLRGNKEGFRIWADATGRKGAGAGLDPNGADFTVGTITYPGGYVIEFKVPLALFDTIDGPGDAMAAGGTNIRFNAAVQDFDPGLPKSYTILWSTGTAPTRRLRSGPEKALGGGPVPGQRHQSGLHRAALLKPPFRPSGMSADGE